MLQMLLSRKNTTVIALHRAGSPLPTVPTNEVGTNSALLGYHYDASLSEDEVGQLVKGISTGHGIDHIDVVIACAGMANGMKRVSDTAWADVQQHLDVNFGGPLKLFQAVKPFLSKPGSKFILISSSVGSLSSFDPVPGSLAYGASKAAANYMMARMNFEEASNGLVAVAIHPGWVRTKMGTHAAVEWGFSPDIVPLTAEQSAAAVLKIIDGATVDSTGGKFLAHDGSELKW